MKTAHEKRLEHAHRLHAACHLCYLTGALFEIRVLEAMAVSSLLGFGFAMFLAHEYEHV